MSDIDKVAIVCGFIGFILGAFWSSIFWIDHFHQKLNSKDRQ